MITIYPMHLVSKFWALVYGILLDDTKYFASLHSHITIMSRFFFGGEGLWV